MATLNEIKEIAEDVNICVPIVKVLVGLSAPARSALRLQLSNMKRDLKAKVATFSFKHRIASRKYQEILKVYAAAGATLSRAKRTLNILNIGPEFKDEPCIQRLLDTLTTGGKVKGFSVGGYRDAENVANTLNFEAQQIARAVDFNESLVKTINGKIDTIDKYIKVLDAIDQL